MKIVVCVKHVPDAQGERGFEDDLTTDRVSVDGLLSELDEYAVEAALQLRESRDDVTVTVLTMGPERAADALKRGLQMGADDAVHVVDDALAGSDAGATSLVLAAAITAMGDVDLVLTGLASTDASMSVVAAMLAERLGLPQATFAAELTLGDAGTVTVRRDGDTSSDTIETTLPAVVSVTDQINEPRFPNFKGIMAAKKKPVQAWTLADLEVDAGQVGLQASWTTVESATPRPPREQGEIVTDGDETDGARALADFLASRSFA